jgi:hypothetical protein
VEVADNNRQECHMLEKRHVNENCGFSAQSAR